MPPTSLLATFPTFSATGVTAAPSSTMLTTMPLPMITPPTLVMPTTGSASQRLAIPPKLIKKILELEYIDMSELVPDSWQFREEEQKCCHSSHRPQRRGPVSEILLWIECYSSLITVLAARYPDKIADFMAYQRTIIKAHKSFIGEGWVTYDICYRRRAAIVKSLDWAQVDFSLYNETFTGRAKAMIRCKYCLSENHVAASCSYAPENPPSKYDLPPRPIGWAARPPHEVGKSVQLCILYNGRYGNKCKFTPCKFAHMCTECHGMHPVANCAKIRPPLSKIPRSESPNKYRK